MHLLLLSLLACGDKDPGDDDSGTTDDTESDSGDGETTTVGASGGTLRSADGIFELYIPPDALSGDVDFTVSGTNDSGPLGRAYVVSPSVDLAVDGTATLTVSQDASGLVGSSGLELPILTLGDGEDPEVLQVDVVMEENVIVRSAVPRVGEVRLLGSGVSLLARVFPASDASQTRFDLKEGQVATTTVTVNYERDSQAVEVAVVDAAQGLDVAILGASPPQDLGVVPRGASVAPALFSCGAASDDASVTHSLQVNSTSGTLTNVKLAVRGDCTEGDPPAAVDLGATLLAGSGNKALLVTESAVVEYDVDTQEQTDVATFDDLDAVKVDFGAYLRDDRFLFRTTDDSGQVELKQVDVTSEGAQVSDVDPGQTRPVDPERLAEFVRLGEETGALLKLEASGASPAELHRYQNDQQVEFMGEVPDNGLSFGVRLADRRGTTGFHVAGEDGVDHVTDAGSERLNERATELGLFCATDGFCLLPTIERDLFGLQWSDPNRPALEVGSVPGAGVDQVFAGPGRWGSRATFPLVIESADLDPLLGLGTSVNGHPMVTGELAPDYCLTPTYGVGLDQGRVVFDCGDGTLVVTDPIEEDLDALADCETDLWESYDPHPGIPIAPSGTSGMIGGADGQDEIFQVIDVPADCVSGGVTVLVDFGQDLSEMPTVSNTTQELVPNPLSAAPQAALFFPVDAGTSAPIEFTLEYGGACTDYVVTSELTCSPATDDASEPNGTFDEADPVELGDGEQIVIRDLSLPRGDVDRFLLELEGECDVTATATDEEEGLEVNQLMIQGHGELAITDLGVAVGGTPGEQSLTYRGLGTGSHWVSVSAPTWIYESYDLTLSADCPFGCYSDVFEPNNTFETRDKYYEKYMGSTPWGDTMTVSDTDTDHWEIPVAVFGCYDDPDLQFTVNILDGDADATLHMSLSDKYGNSWVVDRTMTTETFLAADVLGPYPYSTDLYVEWWAEGGCLEFSVEYEFLCQ